MLREDLARNRHPTRVCRPPTSDLPSQHGELPQPHTSVFLPKRHTHTTCRQAVTAMSASLQLEPHHTQKEKTVNAPNVLSRLHKWSLSSQYEHTQGVLIPGGPSSAQAPHSSCLSAPPVHQLHQPEAQFGARGAPLPGVLLPTRSGGL